MWIGRLHISIALPCIHSTQVILCVCTQAWSANAHSIQYIMHTHTCTHSDTCQRTCTVCTYTQTHNRMWYIYIICSIHVYWLWAKMYQETTNCTLFSTGHFSREGFCQLYACWPWGTMSVVCSWQIKGLAAKTSFAIDCFLLHFHLKVRTPVCCKYSKNEPLRHHECVRMIVHTLACIMHTNTLSTRSKRRACTYTLTCTTYVCTSCILCLPRHISDVLKLHNHSLAERLHFLHRLHSQLRHHCSCCPHQDKPQQLK